MALWCIEDEINFLIHFCHFYLFCSILWPIKEVFCALQTRLPLRHLCGYGVVAGPHNLRGLSCASVVPYIGVRL